MNGFNCCDIITRLSKGFEPIKPYSIGASLKSKTKGVTEK